MGKTVTPPKALGPAGRDLFRRYQAEYGIVDVGGLDLLRTIAECRDLVVQAMSEAARDGLTGVDKYGQRRPHPALGVARDARQTMLAAIRLLHLDLEPIKGIGRPGGN